MSMHSLMLIPAAQAEVAKKQEQAAQRGAAAFIDLSLTC